MDTIKFDVPRYVAEHNPYLTADGSTAGFEVDTLSDGKVDLYLTYAAYQPKHVRDHHAARYEQTGVAFHKARSERQYAWASVELNLTPKQARKLAKALKRAAKARRVP